MFESCVNGIKCKSRELICCYIIKMQYTNGRYFFEYKTIAGYRQNEIPKDIFEHALI